MKNIGEWVMGVTLGLMLAGCVGGVAFATGDTAHPPTSTSLKDDDEVRAYTYVCAHKADKQHAVPFKDAYVRCMIKHGEMF